MAIIKQQLAVRPIKKLRLDEEDSLRDQNDILNRLITILTPKPDNYPTDNAKNENVISTIN